MGYYKLKVREGSLSNEGELTQESKKRLEVAVKFLEEADRGKNFILSSEIHYWEGKASQKTAQYLAELLDINEIRSSEDEITMRRPGLLWRLNDILGLKPRIKKKLKNTIRMKHPSSGRVVIVGSTDSLGKKEADYYRNYEGNLKDADKDINLKPGEAYFCEVHTEWTKDVVIYYPSKGFYDFLYDAFEMPEKVRRSLEV